MCTGFAPDWHWIDSRLGCIGTGLAPDRDASASAWHQIGIRLTLDWHYIGTGLRRCWPMWIDVELAFDWQN